MLRPLNNDIFARNEFLLCQSNASDGEKSMESTAFFPGISTGTAHLQLEYTNQPRRAVDDHLRPQLKIARMD
jgi:hypothetical protein